MSHDAYATPAEIVLGSLGLPSLRVCKDAMKREADFYNGTRQGHQTRAHPSAYHAPAD